MTRVLVVFNPGARGGADGEVQAAITDALDPLGSIVVAMPAESSFADEIRRGARGADVVVVGGGDGTLNSVLNALGDRLSEFTMGLIPMGTGNDLARTLELPDEPVAAAAALVGGEARDLDVGSASGADVSRLFLNACMGGFPVQVDEATDDRTKKRLGPLAFWIGGAKAVADLTPATVTVNGHRLEGCVAAGVGNGRTCGGGVEVWPSARPDDGALDACAIAVRNPAQGALLAARVRSGSHEDQDGVLTDRAESIVIESDPPIGFNVDGELVGLTSPATFEIAGRVRFLVPR
jgi:diacylglycerol kinase (ATP)